MGILMTKFTFTANATTKLHREKKNIKGKLLLENSYSRRQQNLYTHNLSTFDFNKTKTFFFYFSFYDPHLLTFFIFKPNPFIIKQILKLPVLQCYKEGQRSQKFHTALHESTYLKRAKSNKCLNLAVSKHD